MEITKSKLVGLLHRQNKGYMQKISILAQYLGSMSNLSVFASKLRITKYVRIAIFQKKFKDIRKFITNIEKSILNFQFNDHYGLYFYQFVMNYMVFLFKQLKMGLTWRIIQSNYRCIFYLICSLYQLFNVIIQKNNSFTYSSWTNYLNSNK